MDWKEKFFELYESGKSDGFSEALDLKRKNIPNRLYRYRTVTDENLQYRKNEIVEGELYLSHPDELNDPFEGCSLLQSTKPDIYADKSTYMEYYRLQGKEDEVKEIFADENWFEKLIAYTVESVDGKISKDKSREALINVMCHAFEQFNSDLNTTIRKMNRVACFTTNPKNLPMWNHYTYGHKGICLEYDTSLISNVFYINRLYPVKYVDRLPDMTYLMVHRKNPKFTMFDIMSINKLNDWSYEDEWRMVLNAGSWFDSADDVPKDYWNSGKSIRFVLPSRVILGRNILEGHEKEIINYANQVEIPVVKARCTEYGFDFVNVQNVADEK